jgi:hypothetical protein
VPGVSPFRSSSLTISGHGRGASLGAADAERWDKMTADHALIIGEG